MTAARPSHAWVVGLLAAVALAGWLVTHRTVPWTLFGGDEAEYADLGRHLAEGRGFTTSIIFPAELAWGADADHPSLVRAPLWPLVLGATFAVFGPVDWAVHLAALACHLALVAAVTALGIALGGPVAGAAAGLATVTSAAIGAVAVLAVAEPLFMLCIVVTFLLLARGAPPFAVGAVCALAYLTRHNGFVLAPVAALVLMIGRPAPLRTGALCVAGFVVVALPWWIRNVVVAGDPFASVQSLLPWAAPGAGGYTNTPLHMLAIDPDDPRIMNPWVKAWHALPGLLRYWPPASANLAALAGVALAAVRRERRALGWIGLAALTTLSIALAYGRGRYFLPLVPPMLAIGAAAFVRSAVPVRVAGLALLLLAPVLPAFPAEANDLTVIRWAVANAGRVPPPATAWKPCFAGRPLVVAEDAPLVGWETRAVTIWLPGVEADLWTIVQRFPVEFLQLSRRQDVLSPRIRAAFAARPDCGPGVWQRRARSAG